MSDYPKNKKGEIRIDVVIPKRETISLSLEAQRRVAVEYFCKVYGLNEDYHIDSNGYLVHVYEAATSHRFDLTDVIREATEEDRLCYGILRHLKNIDLGR